METPTLPTSLGDAHVCVPPKSAMQVGHGPGDHQLDLRLVARVRYDVEHLLARFVGQRSPVPFQHFVTWGWKAIGG